MRSIFVKVIDYRKLSTDFSSLFDPRLLQNIFTQKKAGSSFFVHHFAMLQTKLVKDFETSIPLEITRKL